MRTELVVETGPLDAPADWRERLVWPHPPRRTAAAVDGARDRYLRWAAALSNSEDRARALLAGHSLLAGATAVMEWAAILHAADKAALPVTHRYPELAYLAGAVDTAPGLTGVDPNKAGRLASISRPVLRRLARTASWDGPLAAPATQLLAQRTAISHNTLLIAEARRAGRFRLAFLHADDLLGRARARAQTPDPARADGLAAAGAAALAADDSLPDDLRTRAQRLIETAAYTLFRRADADLQALADGPAPPMDVWAGTGGAWAARAIGLTALARGGAVTRFSHGGKDGMLADRETLAMIELCVSSRFVFGTEAAARSAREAGLADRSILGAGCELAGGGGHALFAEGARLAGVWRDGAWRTAQARPRLLYTPTILHGARQLSPALLPDAVYLDWQMRVSEALLDAPVDFMAKPHPEGLTKGAPHPLEQVAPCAPEKFEAYLGWADCFLFDWGESTTFWEALCTDRPIVYLDLGLTEFLPEVRAAIEARCTVLPIAYDERGRPILEPDRLRDAASQAIAAGPADSRFFHTRLIG